MSFPLVVYICVETFFPRNSIGSPNLFPINVRINCPDESDRLDCIALLLAMFVVDGGLEPTPNSEAVGVPLFTASTVNLTYRAVERAKVSTLGLLLAAHAPLLTTVFHALLSALTAIECVVISPAVDVVV
jgi:hypothetical protein